MNPPSSEEDAKKGDDHASDDTVGHVAAGGSGSVIDTNTETQVAASGSTGEDGSLNSPRYPDNFMELDSSDEEDGEEDDTTDDRGDAQSVANPSLAESEGASGTTTRIAIGHGGEFAAQTAEDVTIEHIEDVSTHDPTEVNTLNVEELDADDDEKIPDSGTASASDAGADDNGRRPVPIRPFILSGRDLFGHRSHPQAASERRHSYPAGTKGLKVAEYAHGNELQGHQRMRRRIHLSQGSSLGNITTVEYDDKGEYIDKSEEVRERKQLPEIELPDVETPFVLREREQLPEIELPDVETSLVPRAESPSTVSTSAAMIEHGPGISTPTANVPVTLGPYKRFDWYEANEEEVEAGISPPNTSGASEAQVVGSSSAAQAQSPVAIQEEEVEPELAGISPPYTSEASEVQEVGSSSTAQAQSSLAVQEVSVPLIARTPTSNEGLQEQVARPGTQSSAAIQEVSVPLIAHTPTSDEGPQEEQIARAQVQSSVAFQEVSVPLTARTPTSNEGLQEQVARAQAQSSVAIQEVSVPLIARTPTSNEGLQEEQVARYRGTVEHGDHAENVSPLEMFTGRTSNRERSGAATSPRQALVRLRTALTDVIVEKAFAEKGEYPWPGISPEKFAEYVSEQNQLCEENDAIAQQLQATSTAYEELYNTSMRVTDDFRQKKKKADADLAEMTERWHSVSLQLVECEKRGKDLNKKIQSLRKELVTRDEQSGESSDEQTGEPTGKQTAEPSDRQTVEPTETIERRSTIRTQWPSPEDLAEVASSYLNHLPENSVEVKASLLAEKIRQNLTFQDLCAYLLGLGLRFKSERLAQMMRNSRIFERDSASEAAQDLDSTAWSVSPFESVAMANMRRELNDNQQELEALRLTVADLKEERVNLRLKLGDVMPTLTTKFDKTEDKRQQLKLREENTKLKADLRESERTLATILDSRDTVEQSTQTVADRTDDDRFKDQRKAGEDNTKEMRQETKSESKIAGLLEKESSVTSGRCKELEDANAMLTRELNQANTSLINRDSEKTLLEQQLEQARNMSGRISSERSRSPASSKSSKGAEHDVSKDLSPAKTYLKEAAARMAWYNKVQKKQDRRLYELCGFVHDQVPALVPPELWSP